MTPSAQRRHEQVQSQAQRIQEPGLAVRARAPAAPVQRSIKDFLRSPPPPPTAEREAKRQRTIGNYFAAAEKSPAGGGGAAAPAGPSCAVPTPAQRPEVGSATVKSRSNSRWTRPGRTAAQQQKPVCARRISLGEGVRALAAHRREVSVREASNEAASAGVTFAGADSSNLESAEASLLAPAGPSEHQSAGAQHPAQLTSAVAAGAGQSLLRMMLMPHLQQASQPQPNAPPSAGPLAAAAAEPSLLCRSVLEQTSPVALVAAAVSRVIHASGALLAEHDQATVQSPMDAAALQHIQHAGPSAGPLSTPSAVEPEEGMGDNEASRHTYGSVSMAGDASRAQSNSQKENAQAAAARRGDAGGGRPLLPDKGPRCFGTELGVRAAESDRPPSITEEPDMVSSDLS